MSKTPAKAPEAPVTLSEVIDAAGVTSTKEAPAAEPAPMRRAFVRAVYGTMVNVLTAETIDDTPKKVNIDQWIQAQLDAGKLVEGEPE